MELGTHGRIWYTDEPNNIAFSFYIELNCNIQRLKGFTKEIAETMVEVFKNLYNINLEIKEPNDITFKCKKIGGILTETKLAVENVKHIVVGIGINTNGQSFNEQIKNIATSIKNEFKIEIENSKVISEFCNLIEAKIDKRVT